MKKRLTFNLLLALLILSFCVPTASVPAEIYRWVDQNGNVFFSDSPPPSGSFKKQKIEDEIDKVLDQKKAVEKRSDIDDKQKLDERIKIEIEYEKRARAIKNYQMMREDLETLKEKYQKKFDELERQWNRNFPGSSARSDLRKEAQKIKRDYEKEIRDIKNHYGYY